MQFEKDLSSKHKALFLSARKILLSYTDIKEEKKERITTYANKNGGICHLRTMPHGIDIGFLKGVKMKDKYSLLTGKGKTLRVLSLKSLNENILNDYIEEAIKVNTNH